MTTTQEPFEAEADGDGAALAETLFAATLGAFELTLVHIGRELGLYRELRGRPGLTASELADGAGVDARYAREWLEHQAVAGVLAVDDPARPAGDRHYRLPEAHAAVLLDEEHPAHAGAMADIPAMIARTLHRIVAAFRTGAGVPFADYGVHDIQAGMSRPLFANGLTTQWLPALPDVHSRLEGGEALRVADFGCGEGWAGIYLAEAYPQVTVDGFDLDDASIAAARAHAARRGVDDRVRFSVADITGDDISGPYDLALACEVIHDLPDPVGALATMRRVTAGGGAVLVVDEKAAERFEPSGDPLERLLYGFSVLHCLPAGRHAQASAATGTVMRPDLFCRYAVEAGFAAVTELPVEHPMFRFYRPGSERP